MTYSNTTANSMIDACNFLIKMGVAFTALSCVPAIGGIIGVWPLGALSLFIPIVFTPLIFIGAIERERWRKEL